MCSVESQVNPTSLCADCASAYNAAAYQKNAEVNRARALAAYYADKPTKQAYSRNYCAQHKGRLRKRFQKLYKLNPEPILAYGRDRRALKRGASGSHTVAEWMICKAENLHKCIDCGIREADLPVRSDGKAAKLTMGHMRPLKMGGSHWIHNIRPQCLSCNSRQGRKLHPLVALCQIDVLDAAAEFWKENPPDMSEAA
jgi:hypothetical protein